MNPVCPRCFCIFYVTDELLTCPNCLLYLKNMPSIVAQLLTSTQRKRLVRQKLQYKAGHWAKGQDDGDS